MNDEDESSKELKSIMYADFVQQLHKKMAHVIAPGMPKSSPYVPPPVTITPLTFRTGYLCECIEGCNERISDQGFEALKDKRQKARELYGGPGHIISEKCKSPSVGWRAVESHDDCILIVEINAGAQNVAMSHRTKSGYLFLEHDGTVTCYTVRTARKVTCKTYAEALELYERLKELIEVEPLEFVDLG